MCHMWPILPLEYWTNMLDLRMARGIMTTRHVCASIICRFQLLHSWKNYAWKREVIELFYMFYKANKENYRHLKKFLLEHAELSYNWYK